MKTEIYECDRCHKKAITKEEREVLALGDVAIGFSIHYTGYNPPAVFAPHRLWKKEICRACRKELGCIEEEIRDASKDEKIPVPSFEDMVREIVRQEMPGGN
jgi:hypothetical protein